MKSNLSFVKSRTGLVAALLMITAATLVWREEASKPVVAVDMPLSPAAVPSPCGFNVATRSRAAARAATDDKWIDSLLALLPHDGNGGDWQGISAMLTRLMQQNPSLTITGLLDAQSLEEMRPVLLMMAAELCPSEHAPEIARLLLHRCENPAELVAVMGRLLAGTAAQNPRQALLLVPFAAKTTDAGQCLAGMIPVLVESGGRRMITAMARQFVSMEERTALLASAVSHLATKDAPEALLTIDEISLGSDSEDLRSEVLLAAAPTMVATGHAGDLAAWLRLQPPTTLGAESWEETCLLLSVSHSDAAIQLARAIPDASARDVLISRIREIASGRQPPILTIDFTAYEDTNREPVPNPASETP